jgi:hypothetical protein
LNFERRSKDEDLASSFSFLRSSTFEVQSSKFKVPPPPPALKHPGVPAMLRYLEESGMAATRAFSAAHPKSP